MIDIVKEHSGAYGMASECYTTVHKSGERVTQGERLDLVRTA